MPTSEQYLLQRLRDTERALQRQLESIEQIAQGAGIPPHQLLDTTGQLVATPVLVALAGVQVALLQHPTPACTCSSIAAGPAYDCPAHGHG